MWLLTEYAATSLYSLKLSTATSSGAKTLLCPTPYAFKMALLDVAFRTRGAKQAEALWPAVRDLEMAYLPPERAVVTNLFAKALKPSRTPARSGAAHAGPLAKTIAYREYVHFGGSLGIALGASQHEELPGGLADLVIRINYLGKRGGFVQLCRGPDCVTVLPEGYLHLNPPNGQRRFDGRGLLQLLDDCSSKMTFAQASIYSGKSIRLGKERIPYPIVLPYRLVRASKSYTLYERLD